MGATPIYSFPYPDPSDLVRDAPEAFEDLALAIEDLLSTGLKEKKIEAFTASGTWTVPAGVTYGIAHMLGGGGGVGQGTTASDGSDSSVAFASGTVSSPGGAKGVADSSLSRTAAGKANSGRGANGAQELRIGNSNENRSAYGSGQDGQYLVAGAAVTPAASITVTVGAGGAAGTSGSAGGSGYVYIEYYE